MNPLSGLIKEPGAEGARSLTRLLFGVWPVAKMTSSVDNFAPFVRWISNMLPSFGNPPAGITTRVRVISLPSVVQNQILVTALN